MHPKLPLFIRALLAAVMLAFAGCSTLPRASSDVAVTLSDVQAGDATAFETRLTLLVRLTNRSPEALELTGARHEVALNGRIIGTALNNTALALPGLSSVTQEVELNLNNFALIALVRELQRDPAAAYSIESTLYGSGAFARPLRTKQAGFIDLRSLAGAPAS
ncbi:MAG: hypothetical protein EAZ36_02200 [Verrucomicrobia bacterium]|nr:MAG: hypothetical protein EAZ36_02200 [Verrucomicrobiota bacterium]